MLGLKEPRPREQSAGADYVPPSSFNLATLVISPAATADKNATGGRAASSPTRLTRQRRKTRRVSEDPPSASRSRGKTRDRSHRPPERGRGSRVGWLRIAA